VTQSPSDTPSADADITRPARELRRVGDSISEILWLYDTRRQTLLYANGSYRRFFQTGTGEPAAAMAGWLGRVHPQDAERVRAIMATAPSTPLDFESRFIGPDGGAAWLRVRVFPIFEDGSETGTQMGIADDITRQRLMSAELAANEEKFRSIFEESPASIWQLDLSACRARLDSLKISGVTDIASHLLAHPRDLEQVISLACVTDVNRATVQLFGAKDKAGLIRAPLHMSAPASREAFARAFSLFLEGSRTFETVGSGLRPDGIPIDVILRISVASGSEQSWREVLMTVTDISEVKRAHRALEESEEKFRVISEQTQIGICIVQDGRIMYANRSFSELTGFTTGEVMRDGPSAGGSGLVDEEMRRTMRELAAHRGPAGTTTHFPQVRLRSVSGTKRWFSVFFNTISIGGRPAGLASLVDISKEKEAREEVVERGKQLIQADKLASLGMLSAGVAHEINNPNQAILLSSQVVCDAWRDAAGILDAYAEANGDFALGGASYSQMRDMISNCLTAIRECAGRIDTIIGDLKGFARQEMSESFLALDFNMVINSAVTLSAGLIKKSTRNFTLDLAEHLPPVRGSYQKLEQVVINLIQNACQSLPDRSRGLSVTTRADARRGVVVLEVADEGAGIPASLLPRIKDPFFTTKRDAGGTGLGLSVSDSIVEQHGGTMNHVSEPGKGTQATVILPVLRE
jgi:PAS domain S-box-containing protein